MLKAISLFRTKFSILFFAAVAALCFYLYGCSDGSQSNHAPELNEETYRLDIEVDCSENLILSRYDVAIYIDDEKIGTMDHGTKKSFEVALTEGKHTFKATKVDDSSVDGSWDFEMSAEESILRCSIACKSDQVKITDFYAESKTQAAADDEVAANEKERQEAAAAEKRAQEEQAAAEKKAKEEQEKAEKEAKRQEEREQAAQKAAEEKAARNTGAVSIDTAIDLTKQHGDATYPYGFKLHYIAGVLNEEARSDGTVFLKIYCDVRNAYGTWAKDLVCESVVGGTEGNPNIISFIVY